MLKMICNLYFFVVVFFPTHNAEVFHIRVSWNLLVEHVVGELLVHDLLVPRTDEPALLVQEHGGWTAKRGGATRFKNQKMLLLMC